MNALVRTDRSQPLALRDFLPNAAPALARQLDAAHKARRARWEMQGSAIAPAAVPTPPDLPAPHPSPVVAPERARTPAERAVAVRSRVLADRPKVPEAGPDNEPEAPRAPHRIFIRDIQEIVASFYGVTVLDLTCARRTADIVYPRQVAMYLAKTLTPRSFPEIGRFFGDRDHTTVLHALRKIDGMIARDPAIASEVAALRAEVEALG